MSMEAPAYRDTMTEAQFQELIVETAELHGWLVYHTYNSRRSQPGFPDLILIKPPRLRAFEIKTATGKVGLMQVEWIRAFKDVEFVSADIVRPGDWDWIKGVLGES